MQIILVNEFMGATNQNVCSTSSSDIIILLYAQTFLRGRNENEKDGHLSNCSSLTLV